MNGKRGTNAELGLVARLTNELHCRVRDGVRPFDEVQPRLAAIVDGVEYRPDKLYELLGHSGFIGIETTMQLLEWTPGDQEWRSLQRVPFKDEVLRGLCNNHLLVCCGALSIVDLWERFRDHDPIIFQGAVQADSFNEEIRDSPWAHEKVAPGWHLINLFSIDDPAFLTWTEQLKMPGVWDDRCRPVATNILVQAMILYRLTTGYYLGSWLSGSYARTSNGNIPLRPQAMVSNTGAGLVIESPQPSKRLANGQILTEMVPTLA